MILKYEKCVHCGFNTFNKDKPNPQDFAEFIDFGGPDGCYECVKEINRDEI